MGVVDFDKDTFEWTEVVSLFHIKEDAECGQGRCSDILDTVNHLAVRYGKAYVVKNIALQPMDV